MKKSSKLGIAMAVGLILILCGTVSAATLSQETSQAMKTLNLSKGSGNLLVLTNAPYVKVNGACALPYLGQVQDVTGCSVGKGNLLFFQRSQNHPLRMMLFKKSTGDAIIISLKDQKPITERLNLSARNISEASFWKTIGALNTGKDMFTLATIANMWAKGAPYDFLKSAELHNHICPGLTSGYLLAHYILNKYPLQNDERYTVVSCPVWCKEEALQVVLDCTPGKKRMVVKPLCKKQQKQISIKNPAGMLLIWNAKKKSGKGVVLSFDFDRLRRLAPKDAPKAAMVLAVADYLDRPDQFVSEAARFDLNQAVYEDIVSAGSNPYAVLDLLRKE
jgi:formylmethanofuran dehydrogenase subunit E-like metal-binding protein